MVVFSVFDHYAPLCLVSDGLIVHFTLIGRIVTYVAILTNSVIWSILHFIPTMYQEWSYSLYLTNMMLSA